MRFKYTLKHHCIHTGFLIQPVQVYTWSVLSFSALHFLIPRYVHFFWNIGVGRIFYFARRLCAALRDQFLKLHWCMWFVMCIFFSLMCRQGGVFCVVISCGVRFNFFTIQYISTNASAFVEFPDTACGGVYVVCYFHFFIFQFSDKTISTQRSAGTLAIRKNLCYRPSQFRKI